MVKFLDIKILMLCIILTLNSFCQVNLIENGDFEKLTNSKNKFKNLINWSSSKSSKSILIVDDVTNNQFISIVVKDENWNPFQLPFVFTTFKQPLSPDSYYKVSFMVSLSHNSSLAIDGIGCLFSSEDLTKKKKVFTDLVFPQVVTSYGKPLENRDWVEVSGIFKASGNEKHLSIGCFYSDERLTIKKIDTRNNLSEYYIDKVSLFEVFPEFNNIIPNGDFEEYTDCPLISQSMITKTRYWNDLSDIDLIRKKSIMLEMNREGAILYSPNEVEFLGSADLYAECTRDNKLVDGTIDSIGAFSGNTFVGITLYTETKKKGRGCEYLQVKLKSPLIKDKIYSIKISVRLSGNSRFSTNTASIAFSNDIILKAKDGCNTPIKSDNYIQLSSETINSKEKWISYCVYYSAQGGEQYVTIGDFISDDTKVKIEKLEGGRNLAYYLFDSVQMQEVSSIPKKLIDEK